MLASQAVAVAVVLAACFAVFGVLGRLFPCNPGRPLFFSRSIGLDLSYCLFGILYAGVGPLAAAALSASPAGAFLQHLTGALLQRLPTLAQLATLLIATDFAQYWLHRAFHDPRLWPYHAVHHSAPDVNWTTTFRTHPVNYLVLNAALGVLANALGFSELTLLLAAPIFFFSGAVTHANLNWTFGPLRYVVASPVFHRWHHSADADSQASNFAPMFPVWDLMFGTFRMPRGERPQTFGAEGVPHGLLGQLVHPFATWGRSA
ncbi:MAG TPA: sterol desaturase family protein [Caulobacteraceae bacterium]|jgi:sterol desaturase/sphingolipid hydroxylase (fatty acid hydroxylase superfamily)|nr:sterol desaturase family protein [Caulobacteraceae bacterium]